MLSDENILLLTGLRTPTTVTNFVQEGAGHLNAIGGHGLGPRNPKSKLHNDDSWTPLMAEAFSFTSYDATYVTYTARGHGLTTGWEVTAESDPEQFTWERLAEDMIAVADYFQMDQFIASGSSMGAATSFFAAIRFPDRVSAVVMIRPPTAWKERRDRRKFLLSSAKNCEESDALNGEKYSHVLRGAALSDLPDPDTAEGLETYQRIRCPVLLLSIQGDDAHPVSTAETLHRVISSSLLNVAVDKEEARRNWPAIIAQFISSSVTVK